jgi:hypothetical protein
MVHQLRHRVKGFGMHLGAGIYNIDTGRARRHRCEWRSRYAVSLQASAASAMAVRRCLFIVGLVAGYWLLDAAIPVYVRYWELVRIARERPI